MDEVFERLREYIIISIHHAPNITSVGTRYPDLNERLNLVESVAVYLVDANVYRKGEIEKWE